MSITSIPTMSTGTLLTIMGDFQDYLEETKNVEQSDIHSIQAKLIGLGLDIHEVKTILMHTNKVREIFLAMNTDIEIFKKVNKLREQRDKARLLYEAQLLEKKKELEEMERLIVIKKSELHMLIIQAPS
jgi:CRISPR/Cas system-associated exonuclease Cas4 (RecB family)